MLNETFSIIFKHRDVEAMNIKWKTRSEIQSVVVLCICNLQEWGAKIHR